MEHLVSFSSTSVSVDEQNPDRTCPGSEEPTLEMSGHNLSGEGQKKLIPDGVITHRGQTTATWADV